MIDKKVTPVVQALTTSEIAKIVGGRIALHPSESADEYQAGLISTITELEAKTHLQIYLAQKIFDCIWWVRRIEMQKRDLIFMKVCDFLYLKGAARTRAFRLMIQGDWNSAALQKLFDAGDQVAEETLAQAARYNADAFKLLDQQIADRIKAMRDLQTSYEALVNRKVVAERLRIQNQLMQLSLGAPSIPGLIAGEA